jgi:putative tricarboxylic transport membrane protein
MALSIEPKSDSVGANGPAGIKAALIPAVFLGIALWICLEAFQVPFGSFRMPGAGFFPLLLGIALAILALVLLGMNLRSGSGGATQVGPTRPEIFALIGSMFVSVWLFERAGYLLTMGLFLGVTMKVLGKTGWTVAVLVALTGSVASFLLFGRVLSIALPAGILPF